jgi:hypothetical protein
VLRLPLLREENRKRTIQYQRSTPPVPATYADVRLPEEYTTTTNNQQFLQCDNGQNAENRMLVFYSPNSLERLANAQTVFIFMDGTFSVAHWDTTWAKIWLGLSLVFVARSFMAFLVFEYLMLVSLGGDCVAAQELDFHSEV